MPPMRPPPSMKELDQAADDDPIVGGGAQVKLGAVVVAQDAPVLPAREPFHRLRRHGKDGALAGKAAGELGCVVAGSDDHLVGVDIVAGNRA